MNNNAIVPASPNTFFLPRIMTVNQEKRLYPYVKWLDQNGYYWLNPDLAEILANYRDYLLAKNIKPESVLNYLSTIRGRYTVALRETATQNALDQTAYQWCVQENIEANPANIQAMVQRIKGRITDALHPDTIPVNVQTEKDPQRIRLTKSEVRELLDEPDTSTLTGKRDLAILATVFCTGIRAEELVYLEVEHLNAEYEGIPALFVAHGKGNATRYIVYDELNFFLEHVRAWLDAAEIKTGIVFRRIWNSGRIGKKRMSTDGVRYILKQYSVYRGTHLIEPKPHMLRRTLAKRLHDAGMRAEDMQANFGHEDVRTTKRYIGDVSARRRIPPKDVY